MNQRYSRLVSTFIHDAYWTLFEAVYHPDQVPLSKLLDSCTGSGGFGERFSTLWGRLDQTRSWRVEVVFVDRHHDYGGIFRRDGDASFRVPTYLKEWPFRNDAGPVCRRDPLTIAPRMPADLIPNVHTFPCMATPAAGPALPAGEGALVLVDPFLRLPLELRMLVAVGLTTTCVKDLRLSSRAFWFLFHSNQFWASRFLDPRQERA